MFGPWKWLQQKSLTGKRKKQPYTEICCLAGTKHSQLSVTCAAEWREGHSLLQAGGAWCSSGQRQGAEGHLAHPVTWSGAHVERTSEVVRHLFLMLGYEPHFSYWDIFVTLFSLLLLFVLLRLLDHSSETQTISYGISLQCLIQWYSEYSLIFHLLQYKFYYSNKFWDYKGTSIISVLSQLKFLCCIIPHFSSLLFKVIYNKCDVKLQRNPKQCILCCLTAKSMH